MIDDIVKIYKNAAGEKLVIYYDQIPENPREWECNIGEFITGPRCRYVDNESDVELDIVCRDDDAAALDKNPDIVAYLPVYVYEHSGVCMNTTGFSCPWDSGQIGWIVATRENLRRGGVEWKRFSRKRRETVEQWLRGEVETYSAYMSGEVYGYVLYAANPDGEYDDEVLDSCYGYYGTDGINQIQKDHPEFTEEIA